MSLSEVKGTSVILWIAGLLFSGLQLTLGGIGAGIYGDVQELNKNMAALVVQVADIKEIREEQRDLRRELSEHRRDPQYHESLRIQVDSLNKDVDRIWQRLDPIKGASRERP